MKRFYTVRLGYLYITGGCALLSGVLLFVVRRIFALLYTCYSPESEALFIRLSNGIINVVGRTPLSVVLYLTCFGLLFMLRSQMLDSDMKTLLRVSEKLAEGGKISELAVRTGGELSEFAANLERIGKSEMASSPESSGSRLSEVPERSPESSGSLPSAVPVRSPISPGLNSSAAPVPHSSSLPKQLGGEDDECREPADWTGGEAIALVLRTKRILRELSAAESEVPDRESALYAHLESAKVELLDMERSLEGRIVP
ncbi:hypothetical protein SAMN04487895_1023 [Paenibacillus sophorae]|uniref:Uncharacterized protein n=1 Tax=Paenibacillus sophorae TaxID=1333845 RepID=A0A1H8HXY3_9BACL|nr:hypothetical protein [Paenibacillus sophorae]QWU15787.1 hypothetical protein KP014_00410 [Paenibacillus sophorae]SEN60932.1 hypothetical protein SAMN04487895_1023 [Paenibacillus sophorae]